MVGLASRFKAEKGACYFVWCLKRRFSRIARALANLIAVAPDSQFLKNSGFFGAPDDLSKTLFLRAESRMAQEAADIYCGIFGVNIQANQGIIFMAQ